MPIATPSFVGMASADPAGEYCGLAVVDDEAYPVRVNVRSESLADVSVSSPLWEIQCEAERVTFTSKGGDVQSIGWTPPGADESACLPHGLGLEYDSPTNAMTMTVAVAGAADGRQDMVDVSLTQEACHSAHPALARARGTRKLSASDEALPLLRRPTRPLPDTSLSDARPRLRCSRPLFQGASNHLDTGRAHATHTPRHDY